MLDVVTYVLHFVPFWIVVTDFWQDVCEPAAYLQARRKSSTLALSIYVLGFAVGPVLITPLSDYFGRPPVYVISRFILFTLQLLVALAPNIGTILVCRFIGGFAGGAPLANTGGTVSDI